MARLKILSTDEFNILYTKPVLEDEDRPYIFELDQMDHDYLKKLDTPCKIDYILQLVYFRLSQYFFNFTFQSSRQDVWYVIDTYFPDAKFPKKQISEYQKYKNRVVILGKYEMSAYSSPMKNRLERYAGELAKQHTVPKYLFDSLLDYCHQNKVVRPGYSALQEIVSNALENEKNWLSNKLDTLMDKVLKSELDSLMKKDDDYYQLTVIKRDQRDFSTTEIRKTVEKQQSLAKIYQQSLEIIKKLGLSAQNILHYRHLAMYYTLYGLKTMKKRNIARLYLICYVYHRYLRLNDYLIFSLSHKLTCYVGEAEAYQSKMHEKALLEDDSDRGRAANILTLLINKKIRDHELRSKAYEIIPKDKLPQLIQRIRKPKFDAEFHRWAYYGKHAQAIKANIRGVFNVLEFQTKNNYLQAALHFLKTHIQGSKTSFKSYSLSDVPTTFIPKKLCRYIIEKVEEVGSHTQVKKINGDRYEFMLYWQLGKSIGKGGTTIKDSLSHRSLHDELIADTVWADDKEKLINRLENKLLKTDIGVILSHLNEQLSSRYRLINKNIHNGNNSHIKIKHNKQGKVVKWRLPYKKIEDGINNPFYENIPTVSIAEVIRFAASHTSFMKRFKHILSTNTKHDAKESSVSACLVAKGTGSDIYRMKEISDIKEHELKSTSRDFFRDQTLSEASDDVMNKTEKLPIFKKYTLADYGVHASVDGQKLETKYHMIKARYSSKYFGFGKGVSAYTLFANCLPLCSKIIGANEHESHYLFDILNSNTSHIKVHAVSGDMHSINRVNFALLYFFGYRFMPRFTQIDKRANHHLVGFDSLNAYEKYVIKPTKKVNTQLILKEWDNILRILVTLALKKNTQSHIVRKLSSYKLNDTLKALIEFDHIIMSLYLLDYVDDEQVRKNVRRSLNRGESYHQLRSAIAKVSGRKLTGKSEIELTISNECARLLANCIIFYNASILSELYQYYKKNKMDEEGGKIIRCSPVAWQHINLIGMYEFNGTGEIVNLQEVIQNIINDPKINFSASA